MPLMNDDFERLEQAFLGLNEYYVQLLYLSTYYNVLALADQLNGIAYSIVPG